MTDNTEIEVVMKKKMTYREYKQMIENARTKGWTIQAYQIGFYSDGLQQKIK